MRVVDMVGIAWQWLDEHRDTLRETLPGATMRPQGTRRRNCERAEVADGNDVAARVVVG